MQNITVELLEKVLPNDEWNRFVRPDDSPFVDARWLGALERTGCVGGDTGWHPCHFSVRRGTDVIAVAPAYIKENSEGEFVYDFAWADLYQRLGMRYYPKLVLGIPFTPATGRRVLVENPADAPLVYDVVAQTCRELVTRFQGSGSHVLFPSKEENAEFVARGFSERLGIQYQFRSHGARHFEEFLTRLPTKKRTQLRRERKQPARDRVNVRTLSADELPTFVDPMFRFYATTVAKFHWQRRYLNKAFFAEVANTFADHLAWVIAERDGVPIAGAFNAVGGDRLYGRYWGADVDIPFLHFNVCYYHGIDDCLERRLHTFEPGAGGEHKRVRGFDPTITYSAHDLANDRLRAIIDDFLERERHSVRTAVESGEVGDD